MTPFLAHTIQSLPFGWLLVPVVALLAGYLAGLAHFWSLEFVVQRLVEGRVSAILLQLARLAALGLVFWLFTRWGASALVAGTFGVVAAKARVMAITRRFQ